MWRSSQTCARCLRQHATISSLSGSSSSSSSSSSSRWLTTSGANLDATPVQDPNRGKPRFNPINNDNKSTLKQSQDSSFESLKPRIGSAQQSYLQLDSESQRREDLARQTLAKQLGSTNKLYALERERQRLRQIRRDNKDEITQNMLDKSQKNVLPRKSNSTTNRNETSSWKRGEKNRETSKGVSGGLTTRDKTTSSDKLIAGRINKSTRLETSTTRNQIQPIVRGGVPKSSTSARNNNNQRRNNKRQQVLKKVSLPSTVRLENLTRILGVKLFHLQRAMERIGLEDTRPERPIEFNFDPQINDEEAFDIFPQSCSQDSSSTTTTPQWFNRPPVTGIFGHVDHGKTSLLDKLRQTSVAKGEAGGITQHIGAFEVSINQMIQNLTTTSSSSSISTKDEKQGSTTTINNKNDSTITFLDTPGHAAFAAMRSRGTQVTDVVVLVVAADDGVKPQTKEVIELIKQSNVSIVVALTKCDKPDLNISKIKKELFSLGIEIEDLGGEIPCVQVSSLTGQGMIELLETINALAEVKELKCSHQGQIQCQVLESKIEKGKGNVATVLVTQGTLSISNYLVAGTSWCKVKTLTNANGQLVNKVLPGQPVEVTGWKELPLAGDLVLQAKDEEESKRCIQNRLKRKEQEKLFKEIELINEKTRIENELEQIKKQEEKQARLKGLKNSEALALGQAAIDQLQSSTTMTKTTTSEEGVKELLLVIKADVSGTVEAVVGALQGIGNNEAKVKIISSGVGNVQESDVEMARAVGASVVGFNVKVPKSILSIASRPPTPVPIYASSIIYRLVDQIRQAVADLLPKQIDIRVHGEAIVQQLFSISIKTHSNRKQLKQIAGCKISNGIFLKSRKIRLIRNNETLFFGNVSNLKQVKKEVNEVQKGVECGIQLEEFDQFQVNDLIQSIEEVQVTRSL
ncbi:translation initiation factor IF-2 [Microbotryomycetes sp. JL221]|nr:translation initiation factor IF-2 [Microbotryomycetes sp. JL221]